MIDLVSGMVLDWTTSDDDIRLTRILWVNPRQNSLVVFDMKEPNAKPEFVRISDLTALLEAGQVKVTKFVSEKSLAQENLIKDTYRRRRERAWDVIKDMVKEEPAIYDEHSRWAMIQECKQRTGVSHQQIYKWLRRYWHDGKIVNALLPNYKSCGGSRVTEQKATKVGRKSMRAKAIPEFEGIPVTPAVENAFEVAINKWYYKGSGLPLTKVYRKMLEKFFNDGYVEKDGNMVAQLLPEGELPTMRQFRYWYEKNGDREKALRAQYGSVTFEKEFRPKLGNTNHEAQGPGHVFQIDATIADIWLVHRVNRDWLIGRPILYFVIDLFSRLIAGLYVGLEGPSWLGGMMAVENAASDKVAYCASHGIEIRPEEWPAQHVPEILTTDRGEFEGTRPTHLVQTLHTDVQTLPPYRPDWKPVVERSFGLVNEEAIKWVPGAIPHRIQERGGRKYPLDAVLDIEEFEQVMIRMVLKYNNHHVLSHYQRSRNMIMDDVPPVPIHLWNWGRKNEYNGLHTFPKDILRLNLLPSENALITQKGIRFRNRYYVGETALRKQWFVGGVKSQSLPIHFDPRNIDEIYVRLNDGKGFEVCHLADIYSPYRGLRDEEARDIDSYEETIMNPTLKFDELQAGIEQDTHIDEIIREAKKKRKNIPNKEMKKENVREHRSDQKAIERQNSSWHLGRTSHQQPSKIVQFPDAPTPGEVDDADYSDLIADITDLGDGGKE
ncbi:Mu transposase C-terminal domain-containing protein [Alicyclobacillus sp. SO9]|uniref:Mu transposase C-terminal domain-containing protein n=1 Tax=Alicyclobacillus sp. SO9 TaxID=2665646 RepID=UPI0018E8C2F1|nr:Mu transposase C-terminal domain-containing protein [Alicyclobacillus sp. SO9]QQE78397.1 transposase [Alicyclobacillus sp. SO9]